MLMCILPFPATFEDKDHVLLVVTGTIHSGVVFPFLFPFDSSSALVDLSYPSVLCPTRSDTLPNLY